MKKTIVICVTIFLTATVSIILWGVILNKNQSEYSKLEECYDIANLKREIRKMSNCVVTTGVLDENGCSVYRNPDKTLENYRNDLNKCLKND